MKEFQKSWNNETSVQRNWKKADYYLKILFPDDFEIIIAPTKEEIKKLKELEKELEEGKKETEKETKTIMTSRLTSSVGYCKDCEHSYSSAGALAKHKIMPKHYNNTPIGKCENNIKRLQVQLAKEIANLESLKATTTTTTTTITTATTAST